MHRHPPKRTLAGLTLLLLAAACGGTAEDPDPDRYCELNAEIEVVNQRFDGDQTPAEYEDALRTRLALAERSLSVAPTELRADIELLIEANEAGLPLLEAASFDLRQVDEAAFEAFLEEYGEPVNAAETRVEEWAAANC
jgi:hypothetical protein